MLYYFNSKNSSVAQSLYLQLENMINSLISPGQPIVVMCIGSDRSTGDSLGPLTGYKLKKAGLNNISVIGTLNHPVHAANLNITLKKVYSAYNNPFIIAIDASLGKETHIGYITLATGPLKPGLGVKKKLPEVGDIHITGIVNSAGIMDNILLQTTHLATIMTLADIIADAFIQLFNSDFYSHTQQEPSQSYLPVHSS